MIASLWCEIVLSAYVRAAEIEVARGDHQEASEHYCEALEAQETLLGSSHDVTLSTVEAMARLFYKMGDIEGALLMTTR